MVLDVHDIEKAIAAGSIAVETLAAWIEKSGTLEDVERLGVAVYRAMARHGVDPIFGSKKLADAAGLAAEVAADVAEDAKFPPAPQTLKSG